MSFSSPTSRAQRSRRILPWLLYLYALVLFAIHFVRIFDNSFWGDEGFSIGLAQMNVFEMLQVTAADNHPPLYYLFTQLLYHLLGNSRWCSATYFSLACRTLYAVSRIERDTRTELLSRKYRRISPTIMGTK